MRLLIFFTSLTLSIAVNAQNISEQLRTINSGYDEQGPVLSPDGQTLYFTVGNHPANTGGMRDPGDIWFSRRNGLQWSPPEHAGSLLNDRGYNAVAGFSPDGSQLFLHGHYGSQGGVARTQGISISRRRGDTWTRPENISIPYFMNKSSALCGAISDDNSVFVFSAESYGTHGVDDLYVSVKEGGKWTEPKNLGKTINTQFQELSPSLSRDLKTLYFSSNGRKGFGSFDVYASKRLDDSWQSWSVPENLGQQVNSEGRELYYRDYPDFGFALFTTTKSSDGYGDVKVYATSDVLPIPDSTVYAKAGDGLAVETPSKEEMVAAATPRQTVPAVEARKPAEVTVYGKIRNARSGELVNAKISFEAPGLPALTAQSGSEGYHADVVPAQYTVRIQASGYISTLEKLDIATVQMPELEMNFNLQPVEIGTTVNLKNVLFAQAKAEILPESYPELDMVVSFMKENPTVRIELMGHTDGRGVHADNVKLSQQRVNRVKAYLVSKGIESRRISGKGFGGSKPIASNDTEESRRLNRRVEFVIKKF